jgi:D-glycero-D-manno-heptose 1,7-bisphosphate phosphatase
VSDSANRFSARALHTVFLDRDGVLNRKQPEGCYVTSWSEFQTLPGVPQAIVRLNRAGVRVLVVSNQRGIALGLYTSDDVRRIHAAFQHELQSYAAHIDAFYFCPHDKLQCSCRKPLPGLFHQAQADFPEIDAASSLMIGDSLSDIEFGHRLGMKTVYIEGDPQHQRPGAGAAHSLADLRFPSLIEATDALLEDRIQTEPARTLPPIR